MSIPEGWPTEEMMEAAKSISGDYGTGLEERIIAALAAAPTPEVEPLCPRPFNGRPDHFPMAECILAGECGCTAKGHEYAQNRDELVKAAEELRDLLLKLERNYGPSMAIVNLRAALDKVKP